LGKETKLSYKLLYRLSFDNNTQVVFLTYALSVFQALMNDNLPQLEQALYTSNTLRTSNDGSLVRSCQLVVSVLLLRSFEYIFYDGLYLCEANWRQSKIPPTFYRHARTIKH
jgi:hypothetical protein